jgi:AraC-like DNA-binding protein
VIKKAFGEQELSFFRVKRSGIRLDPALKIEQNELLDSFVNSMMPYFDHPNLVREELLLLKLKELVYILSDSGNNEIVSQLLGTLYTREEIEFDEIIKANLFNNLSISELAHLTAKSESSFKRYFTKYYKESPAKYFKIKRLEKAAGLLKDSSLLISEIAWDCGFENAAHFSDSFRAYFGKAPKIFRV